MVESSGLTCFLKACNKEPQKRALRYMGSYQDYGSMMCPGICIYMYIHICICMFVHIYIYK